MRRIESWENERRTGPPRLIKSLQPPRITIEGMELPIVSQKTGIAVPREAPRQQPIPQEPPIKLLHPPQEQEEDATVPEETTEVRGAAVPDPNQDRGRKLQSKRKANRTKYSAKGSKSLRLCGRPSFNPTTKRYAYHW